MSVISVNLSDEHLAKTDTIARILRARYGVPVSRSEIIRRAIVALPLPGEAPAPAATAPATDGADPRDLPAREP